MWNRYSKWYFGNGMGGLKWVNWVKIQFVLHQICPFFVGKHPRPLAHIQNRGEEWVEPHLHSLTHWILARHISCWIVQQNFASRFLFVCTNLSGEFMYGCKMTLPSIFHFISCFSLSDKYEHYYSCTIRTAEKYFSVFVQYSYQRTGCFQENDLQ